MLEVKSISNDFLKDISFKVNKGDIFNVVGPNGAGKSTLGKSISGLQSVKSGKIFFKGKNITKLGVDKRAKMGIVYIFQHIPNYSHIKIHTYFQKFINIDKNLIKNFEKYGMIWDEYRNRYFDDSLSGGEKKKIELILNISIDAQVYILDEIDSGLDFNSVRILSKHLKELSKNGKTILLISHNNELMSICNRGIVLCEGKIMFEGDKNSLKNYYIKKCGECEKFIV